tara:strand:+ start:851 stop:1054 length:204 start_codon:yes stop_codon:yes gene_type:complete
MNKYEMDNIDPVPKDNNIVDEVELQLKKVVMYWEKYDLHSYVSSQIVVNDVLKDLHSILNYIENEKE